MRQALNYAIDKNALAKIVTFGVGKPMVSFMSSATPLVDNNGPLYPYDLEKAKALLKEAGFAEGTEVTCIGLAGNADETAILSTIQQMWAQVGVKLNIEQLDNATRTARYRDGRLPDARVGLDRRHQRPEPDHLLLRLLPEHPIPAQRLAGQERRRAVREVSSRRWTRRSAPRMYKEIQEIYIEAAPIFFLYESPYPVALRKNVKGFIQIPLGNNIFAGAYVEK